MAKKVLPYGAQAEMVEHEVMLALLNGETQQTRLVDQVSKRLPNLNRDTLNALVRGYLRRESGHRVQLREMPPNRRFWSLAQKGLESLYPRIIDLQAFSKAVLELPFSPYGKALPFYTALASSKGLSKLVQADLDLYGPYARVGVPSPEKTGFSERHEGETGLTKETRFWYEIIHPLIRSVVSHLARNENLRREVGAGVLSDICEVASGVARGQRQQLTEFEKSLDSLKPV